MEVIRCSIDMLTDGNLGGIGAGTRAFEIALNAKPWTVMCSYNPVNGVYASENKHLLNDILRNELGFDGVIVSDWGAVKHRAK